MKITFDSSDMSAIYWSLEDLLGHGRKWMTIETDDDGKIVSITTNRGEYDIKTGKYK